MRQPISGHGVERNWINQRVTWRGLWLLLWPLCLCVTPDALALDPADAAPDSASVVVRWKAPQATVSKLADYVDTLQPGFGTVVKGSLPTLGQMISIPPNAGIDFENDWWVLVFADSDDDPAIVYVIPTTDIKGVEAALPDEFEFHAAGNLAIYSKSEDALKKVRDRIGGKGMALWSRIDASSKKLFDTSDLSALINVRQLSEAFHDELEQAEPQLNKFLDDLSNLIPEGQRAQMTAAFDVYRVVGKGLLQGVNDSDTLTVGIAISKDIIRCEDRLQVQDGTETSQFLSSQPTSDLSLIGRLPGNKSAYFGTKLDMSSMIDWSMNMTKAMLTNLSDQQKAEFDAAVKGMKDLQYGDMAWYFDLDPTAAGALRAASVSEVTPTDRLRDLSRSMIKTMNKIEATGFTQTSTLEAAAMKIGGADVDRITIKQDVDDAADPQGFQKKFRELLFGEEGIQQLVMYQPKRVLQTFGGGASEMQRLATALGSTTSNDATVVAKARKRLIEKANLIALVDVARLAASGVKLAIKEGAIPLDPDAIDGLKLTPSFIGFSIAFQSTAAVSQFEIPVEQAGGIARLVSLLMNTRR